MILYANGCSHTAAAEAVIPAAFADDDGKHGIDRRPHPVNLAASWCSHVARELGELIKEHKVFVNPVTWGGGDSSELLAEFSKNHADFPHFGRRWIDVKTWYTYLMLTKGKTPSGGLASAMGYFKLHFKGKAHRADVDAANTLALFFKLLERQDKLENITELAKNV